MSEEAGRGVNRMADAESDVARVQRKIDAARAVLMRLLQEVVVAETQVQRSQAAQMLEVNEELVMSGLRSQADAATAMIALDDATRAAELDSLTQLPNRVLLLDRLHQAIASAERHGGRLALLFVDIDNFKEVNDTLGHVVGDDMLRRVASCLVATLRAADTACRWGGDEFVVLLTKVSRPADAGLIAGKIAAALAALPALGDLGLQLTASIGVSIYPDDGTDAAMLIAHADAAMYGSKRLRPGGHAFHGRIPEGGSEEGGFVRQPPPGAASARFPSSMELAERELHHARLREVNEQLVLAAISAQELKEAAEQAQQRQTEFMAVVAKELSNPMAPIRIATAMLGRRSTDEPLLPRVQAIVDEQVTQMSRLVEDVLEVSRNKPGKPAPAGHLIDMAGVIANAVADCRPALEKRRQQLKLLLPAGAIMVEAQAEGLLQIVVNLLDNASKYTPDGGEIDLQVLLGGATLTMTVTDTGIGITAQALPDIFEPFGQDSAALGFNGVGMGIGLTAVRALVHEYGGAVLASSAGSGFGSRFVVTLPLPRR